MVLGACSSLAHRTSFGAYVEAARKYTNNTFIVSNACQETVCNALYGTGNPDLDGVGMITGYLISNILAVFFASSLVFLERHAPYSKFRQVLRYGGESFYECAVFFTFSVQIAGTIMLSKVDYGVSASGIEDTTVRETWAVSTLTMIPLIYGAFIPQIFELHKESPLSARIGNREEDSEVQDRRSKRVDTRKQQLRFLLFVFCWMLSLYHFFSRMIESFGSKSIGDSSSSIITAEQWYNFTSRCWTNVKSLTKTENTLMNGFGITASLLISIITLTKLAIIGLRRNYPQVLSYKFFQQLSHRNCDSSFFNAILLIVAPFFAATQFWTLFELRSIARQRSEVITASYASDAWTFGQVVSVTIFVPVLVTCCFQWLQIHKSC